MELLLAFTNCASVLLLMISAWYLYYYITIKNMIFFPTFQIYPFIGNLICFKPGKSIALLHRTIRKHYNGVFYLIMIYNIRIVMFCPDAVEFVLQSASRIKKSYEYRYLQRWLGTGLLTSWNPKWKKLRKLIEPAFHFDNLKNVIEVFDFQSDILIQKLDKEVGKGAFDVCSYIEPCTLDIIYESAMGTQINIQENSNSIYADSLKELFRIFVNRISSPIKMWKCFYFFSKDCAKENCALENIHRHTDFVIKKRRQELMDSLNNSSIKRKFAFLDLLLQYEIDGQSLSDKYIRDEINSFILKGHYTIACGINFTLYLLSRHSKIQDKVVEELRHIFSDSSKKYLTYKDLQDMQYMEMVIKESLRLYPPVPLYSRVLEEATAFDKQILKKGTTLTVFAYGLHRQPNVFSDPDSFDPERFSPENSAKMSSFAYVPFSAGPRNCIGEKFAMMELKTVLAKVLKQFELIPAPEHEPVLEMAAVLRSANGLPVILKRRYN